MIKKLLVLAIAFPLSISAMMPNPELQEWLQKCNTIDKAITAQTVQLSQVEDFFKEKILRPEKLIPMAINLQRPILSQSANPSESALASLYFLKKTAETNLPGSQQLRLDEITQRYEAMYLLVFPPAGVEQQKSSSSGDIYKIFSLKGGIALALIAFVVYYATHKEKEQPKNS